ncbi:MAG TPA: hypothetical protein VM143_06340 [Acidimicrobiales bacterium]|nr:hypothetical protein [Acidimicrobiales bacterium]
MASNEIHPTAVVGSGVKLGSGNLVAAFAVLEGPLEIGDGNWFGPHCSIGTPAQWTGVLGNQLAGSVGNGVRIGHRNVIREYVTVHQGTDRVTTIEDETYLMAYAHVPHDAHICARSTLTNAAQLAGHTQVGWLANLGLGTVVHQRTVIGPYAMVGMQSVVTSHLPPAVVAFGSPARVRGVNRVGLERAGFTTLEIEQVAAAVDAEERPAVARLDAAYKWFDDAVAANR